MSEDMVKDGYEDIMNVDISSVAIEMMRTKHASVPQLKCTTLYISSFCCFFCLKNYVKEEAFIDTQQICKWMLEI